MEPTATYRADIDGLRAIAVLLVVLYHFGVGPSGGFIGVDVFFVISGYLITSNIYQDIRNGSFSFVRFYERRFRRILPALALVISASLVLGWVWLMPTNYEILGWQAASAIAGLSNFYFWQNTDYFSANAEFMPLLHTWSLGVEEQFYLIWPFAIWLCCRASLAPVRIIRVFLIAILVGSFLWSQRLVSVDQPQSFYMIYTRSWELALGGAIVFLPILRNRVLSEWTPLLGMVLIILSSLILTSGYPFPGASALGPCIGAALIIWPRSGTSFVSAILATPPAALIGKTSYSIYLWHWPILVFYRLQNSGELPAGWDLVFVLMGTMTISWLSWKYVEMPFRHARMRPFRALGAGLATMVAIGGLSSSIVFAHGHETRIDPDLLRLARSVDWSMATSNYEANKCFLGKEAKFEQFDQEFCLKISETLPNVLLWGDSHAAQLIHGLRTNFPELNFLHASSNSCTPWQGARADRGDFCRHLNDFLFNDFDFSDIDLVLISGQRINRPANLDSTLSTARFLISQNTHPVIIGPSPEYNLAVRDAITNMVASLDHLSDRVAASTSEEPLDHDEIASEFYATNGIPYLSILEGFCENDRCDVMDDGEVITFDSSHLTDAGSIKAIRSISLQIAQLLQD